MESNNNNGERWHSLCQTMSSRYMRNSISPACRLAWDRMAGMQTAWQVSAPLQLAAAQLLACQTGPAHHFLPQLVRQAQRISEQCSGTERMQHDLLRAAAELYLGRRPHLRARSRPRRGGQAGRGAYGVGLELL